MVTAGFLNHDHVTTEMPCGYEQTVTGPKDSFRQKGINKEFASQHKNNSCQLVPHSEASNIMTSRSAFSVIELSDESGQLIESAKGRFVARGFQQVAGIE